MPKLDVTERFTAAVERLRTLPDDTFERVLGGLRDASRPNPAVIAEGLPAELQDREDVVQAVFALYNTKANSDVPMDAFVDDVVEAMREKWTRTAGDVDTESFKQRLTRLLSVEAIGVVTKASRVLNDYERALYEVKILSDLRPVFGDDIAAGPVGMGIVHNLEVRFHKGGRHEKIFFALTTADLKKLRAVVDRAEEKVTALRERMRDTGVAYLEGE